MLTSGHSYRRRNPALYLHIFNIPLDLLSLTLLCISFLLSHRRFHSLHPPLSHAHHHGTTAFPASHSLIPPAGSLCNPSYTTRGLTAGSLNPLTPSMSARKTSTSNTKLPTRRTKQFVGPFRHLTGLTALSSPHNSANSSSNSSSSSASSDANPFWRALPMRPRRHLRPPARRGGRA